MEIDNSTKLQEPVQLPAQKYSFLKVMKDIVNEKGHFVIIVGVVVLLLVVGGIGYFYTLNKKTQTLQNNQVNQPSVSSTPTSTQIPSEPENLKAIIGDVKFSYFYNPHDNQKLILKQVDFKTNKSQDITLPYFTVSNNDESKRGKYIVSPNGKYVLRLTRNLLEIAELSNPVFRTVHKVQSITDPKWQKVGENIGQNFDFAHMDDAMWDNKGKLYFVTGVGLDGVGAPEGGAYTNLYVTNEDGNNVKLINDHTKENQNYGFMKHFAYIDTSKNEIYFSGDSHGGHLSTMIVVDATTGVLKQSLKDTSTDIVNPVFNKDFSKAYYEQDFKEQGYTTPVKIYEYDMNTKNKKLVYSVANATEDYTSPQIENYPSGALYLNQTQNKLYFQVRDGKTTHFYVIDLTTGGEPKLLFDDNNSCERKGISDNSDFILLVCKDTKTKVVEYQFHQVSSNKRSTFYKDKYKEDYYSDENATIQPFSFR